MVNDNCQMNKSLTSKIQPWKKMMYYVILIFVKKIFIKFFLYAKKFVI